MDIVFAESYQLGFYAHGLNPDKIKEYTCRYKLDELQVYSKYPVWCFQSDTLPTLLFSNYSKPRLQTPSL